MKILPTQHTSKNGEAFRSGLSKVDRYLILVFFLVGAIPFLQVFRQAGYAFFYQNFTPEAVMWACGEGFRHPNVLSDQLAAFLLGRQKDFDCASLAGVESGPAGLFANLQPYLSWSAALLWSWLGVNQLALTPLVALLAATFAGGCYAICRLFLPRWSAVLGAAVLCLSPVATDMVRFLRDYSKAPFFLWTVVFMVLAFRQTSLRMQVLFSALAGAAVGFGYGFRADLAIMLPFGFLPLAIFAAARLRQSPGSILVPLAFLATAGAAALPILVQTNITTNGGSLAIQGASEYFRKFAALEPAGYALDWTYSDELTFSEISAAERPEIPDWDGQEGDRIYGVSLAAKLSTKYLLSWAPIFAGDFASQGLKAAAWMLGYPTLVVQSGQTFVYAGSKHLLSLYQVIGKSWLPYLGLAGFLALLWRIYRNSKIEALCVFVLLALLAGYPGIQFATRHIFHLEFLWVVCVLSLLAVPFDEVPLTQTLRRFAGWSILVAGVVAATYAGLILWQRSILAPQIQDLLSAPRTVLATKMISSQTDGVLYGLPVPADHTDIVASPPDSMVPAIRLTGLLSSARAEADRLALSLGGGACPAGPVTVHLVYEKTTDVWQPMDTNLTMTVPDGGTASAFFPAFYRATQHFAGVSIPTSHSGCKVRLERIDAFSRLPLAMSGLFSENQLVGPLDKGFGGFAHGSESFIVKRP